MFKKRIQQITDTVLRALSGRQAIPFPLSREETAALLEPDSLARRAQPLLDSKERLTAQEILSAFEDILDTLAPPPEEGWLSYTYRFACACLFPRPDNQSLREASQAPGALLLLALLQAFFDDERRTRPREPLLDISLLREVDAGPHAEEYHRFASAYRREFVYETMRLGMEATPFRALEHIAGVNFVAMSVAKDLKRAGFPVDLALVSGAAVSHDIGKFGCRPGERVPYLHYYYTDQWCRRHKMDAIGHIAANHSVWDLELENLTVESLILIYADFRAKQERGPHGEEICRIFSLKDSFDVILNKLDNVDEKKRRRYTFVYAKLRDFERYMISLGVDTELKGRTLPPAPRRDIALMDSGQVVAALKRSGVEHSLRLMRRLSNQRSFSAILEEARGETSWSKQRAYLSLFETYSIYLNANQKQMMLTFLYEQLMHREGDVRRQAAALMGEILANFHAGYVKEVPAGHVLPPDAVTDVSLTRLYISRILYPDHKLIQMHKRWLNYTLKMVMTSLLSRCAAERQGEFLSLFLAFFAGEEEPDDTTAFTLLDAGAQLPLVLCTEEQLRLLLRFTVRCARREAVTVRAAALELLTVIAGQESCREEALQAIRAMTLSDSRSLSLQRQYALMQRQGGHEDDVIAALENEDLSEIFLENLKAATPWIIKKGNIRTLTVLARVDPGYLLHIATHLSNLLMVSEQVTIRRTAGNALLSIAPLLNRDQRNEVAVELTRGLETGQQEFSKYIPDFLGRFYLFLPPSQLEERLIELNDTLCSANSAIVAAALATVGVLYENYGAYRSRFPEEDSAYRDRRERLLGMLLKGLAGFRSEVRQEAMLVIGESVFGSKILSDHDKRRAFLLAAKKLLFLLNEDGGGGQTFFYRAAAMSHIYRFIIQEELLRSGFPFEEREKIAFFPGTFDPFTLSHKGIVRAIRDLGFEVMLAIDEFSWSKKTQPHRIRRRLASISVADEFHVHIFPEDFPVNLSNSDNLRRLREAFPGKEVYIVVGSDVVANASAYKAPPDENSIHTFHHVIFRRVTEDEEERERDYSRITGKIVELSLPPHLEDISSTRIRDAIDANRDISNLIDPVAQEYIYRHNLYLREPQNKPVLQAEDLSFHCYGRLDDVLAEALLSASPKGPEQGKEICRRIRSLEDTVITLRQEATGQVRGFVSLHCLDSHELYGRLGDARLSAFVRQNAGGKALAISGIYAPKGPQQQEICQYLLTEALTYALRQEYTYAFFYPMTGNCPAHLREILTLQGFVSAPSYPDTRELLVVDMRRPIVLTRNMDTVIKAPLNENPRVRAALTVAHRRLQRTLTRLYPGNLVLSISATLLHRRLVGRITARNGVPPIPTSPRVLGPCICVPFGKILRGAAVPNTVTKTLHTDKVYNADLSGYSIEAYPGYSPLSYQVKTIRAFNRPAILVDDMLHDGKRIHRVIPLLEAEGTSIDEVLVGYLTGMGRDTMQEMGHRVDCIYYLPNLRMRFVESTLYPFIGGDTVQRSEPMAGGLQPAVNRIFPYAAPDYSEDCADGSTYRLSLCCLENARDILLTLEAEYRALYARSLTLGRLSEAIILPLYPDRGGCITYDPNRAASTYLENDLMMLRRMRSKVRIVIGSGDDEE